MTFVFTVGLCDNKAFVILDTGGADCRKPQKGAYIPSLVPF